MLLKRVTIRLDSELIVAAKAVATKRGLSLSAMVRAAIEEQVALDARISQLLADYSTGVRSRGAVMDLLGIDDYGTLLRLLNAAGLPHPAVPAETRQKMTAAMVDLIRQHEVD